MAEMAERELKRYGIPVVDRVNVLTAASANDVFFRWDAFGCDGAIVASSLNEAILPVSLIRQRYPDMPILSSESLDKLTTQDALGTAAENLFIVTYHPSSIKQDFYQHYTETFAHKPDLFAITGYMSLHLLADAMNRTQSTEGAAIAAWLRGLRNYDTVIGSIHYNDEIHTFEGQPFVVTKIGE
jgi:ABC-type branched-subunit amino acid transport system substrate-binding protein